MEKFTTGPHGQELCGQTRPNLILCGGPCHARLPCISQRPFVTDCDHHCPLWPHTFTMSTFQALMALSETQTRQSQNAVQTALAQRQRKEDMRRKQLAEQERKEQELAKQRRMKIFEDERREKERQQKLEQDRAAKEAVLQKREEEARNALLYGPKKAKALSTPPESSSPKWPSSSSQNRAREEVRKRRLPTNDDDSAPDFLTREEKRERKQQIEMRKLFNSSKRSSNAGSYSKPGRRLPGGAVDVTTTSQMADSAMSSKSVKERIAAMPNTLTKLNTVKRDTRTIDEILQDRAKAREVKVLDGEDARVFDDWFGSSKKKEAAKKTPAQTNASVATSGANTPVYRGDTSAPQSSSAASKKVVPPSKPSLLKTAAIKAAASTNAGVRPTPASSRPGTSGKNGSSARTASTKPSKDSASSNVGNISKMKGSAGKKRARSPSLSDSSASPPPKKRGSEAISEAIWQIFGRDRNSYVSKDVFSDDEDMEADATLLEREEKMSARIAKKEDTLALEEERRREEEKRRRKREKDARERRN
ncbi:hypothetical protein D9615_005692 [Tricholomella constricta]|uniref:Uncharacterized protein n=1 Tax=Tricholomella constricta TaxID=117010 RepID=A0A8H5HAZ7_9AGAR|nr:hypothetical protein D9615_005692 [Tricholomella constricta]